MPSGAKIIEIAVTNTLRKRVSTFYRYDVENVSADDTIRIDVGKQNVGMFSAINNTIFQGTATTCSRCHSTEKAARGLDLSAKNAYKNLVAVKSNKDEQQGCNAEPCDGWRCREQHALQDNHR